MMRILWGYTLASAASGLVVACVTALPLFFIIMGLILFYAAAPAALAILAAERFDVRTPAYYCAVATVIGVALPWWVSGREAALLITGLLFGPVAGSIYWRIAGRHAGSWRTRGELTHIN